jgi:hypothetical protein
MLIYMDESGFTGEDLLHLEQPVFVHVSTCLSDEECAALAKDHFSGVQGDELKHKRLGRRPNGQSRILDFVNAVVGKDKFTIWLCHKEFTSSPIWSICGSSLLCISTASIYIRMAGA